MLSSNRSSIHIAKRFISISPAISKINTINNNLNNNSVNHKFKFSYENAKNKQINQNNLSLPENKLDFSNYNNNSSSSSISLLSNDEAKLIPSIVALHARLNLPKNYPFNTLVKSLTCPTNEFSNLSLNNQQLSILGSHILSFYISEYLMTNYPRLPISILKSAIDSYIGDFSLYDLAKNNWGIEEDLTSKLDKYLSNEPEIFKFGKLRYIRKVTNPEINVTKYSNDQNSNTFELSKAEAYANSVRSIIAGLYIHSNNNDLIIKNFINNHILSRQIDIESLFQFKESGKLLSKILKSNNLQPPVVKLISETGRLSSTPVYVVGCFSGENLLSTAEGCSLREARIKSFNKALKAWYLYKPLDTKLPSDEGFNGMFVDQGEKFY